MKKKALALALALCMVLSMLPVTAFAAQPQPAPAPAEAAGGPEIRYQPLSDVQPASDVQVQPQFAVGENELIIQYTEGGEVYYEVQNDYSARFWAIPDEGYYVDYILVEFTENLSEPSVDYRGFNEFEVRMARCDVRLTIFFEKLSGPTYKIKVVADDVGGTYTIDRTSGRTGEYVRLHVVPDRYCLTSHVYATKKGSSQQIEPWRSGGSVNEPMDFEFLINGSDLTIHVEFGRYGPYKVKAVAFNKGGTVSIPVEKAYYGEVIPMTVIPDPGYRVLYITFEGLGSHTSSAAYAGNNIWNVTMGDGWTTIYVSFTENINPITVNAGPGGTAFTNVDKAKEGDTVTLTCTPDEGYRLESITGVKDLRDNGDGTYSFTMPEKAVTIDVTFKNLYNPVTLTVETGLGGSAITNVTEGKEGDLITLTCTPDEGYRVARIAGVKGLTDNGDGTYTFTMPDEAVDIKVLFLRHENPFLDVNETHFFYDPVLWAVENGITSGMTPTEFGPFSVCNRAQVVTFLWRAAGSPEPTTTENPFEDVKEGDFFYKPVLWAVENGITKGLDAAHFGPGTACNRAQVVTFLFRARKAALPEDAENPFEDVKEGDFFYESVLWALENGVTTGADATHFNPNGQCQRAQVVTFLYRADQIPEPEPEPEDPTEPTDPEEPVEPTDPTEPVEPEEPTDPTDPVEPVEPTDPVEPEPTEPVDPEPIE